MAARSFPSSTFLPASSPTRFPQLSIIPSNIEFGSPTNNPNILYQSFLEEFLIEPGINSFFTLTYLELPMYSSMFSILIQGTISSQFNSSNPSSLPTVSSTWNHYINISGTSAATSLEVNNEHGEILPINSNALINNDKVQCRVTVYRNNIFTDPSDTPYIMQGLIKIFNTDIT
tara:strand:+ start:989 stop:1510 length:522 start_codon:yes stop_codon:yes gene_type:complete